MKQIIIIGLIILLSVNMVSADTTHEIVDYGYYSWDGVPGNYHYVKWTNASSVGKVQVSVQYCRSFCDDGGAVAYVRANIHDSPLLNWYYKTLYVSAVCTESECDRLCPTLSHTYDLVSGHTYYTGGTAGSGSNCGASTTARQTYILYLGNEYFITGNTGCIDGVILSIKDNTDVYIEIENEILTSPDSFNFSIIEGESYYLNFSDGHNYQFDCTGNIVYNYDLCNYYTLNFLDNCATPLINPHITIFRDTFELIYDGYDNPVNLLIGTTINTSDFLDIIIWTCDGAVMYSDYASIIEKDLYHPTISWDLNVHVIDDNTELDISQAKVTRIQNCCIEGTPSGYALTQTDGHVIFTGLANSNINLTVEKSGYNTYSKTITVGSIFNCWSDGGAFTVYMNATTGNSTDDFNNGTNETDSYDGEGNNTLIDNHQWGCGVYFKNANGIITDTINDTDAYVDMYYWIKGCNATLKFQSQIYTYWYTDVEYPVLNNSGEYRRILNTNFSDYTNSYRGYIYNSSCDCNDIQNLYVINQTYEEETHYENLTSYCWIKNKVSGNQIDYRSDIKCVIYANSTNSTLLDITVNFMNGTTLVDSKILNWADFVSGSPKWYYTWYPDYEYTSGFNYTLNTTGFNGYQLDTDEVWTADIIGNELTVFVKDNYNQQVLYATIFIEDWGSIATGAHNYATVTGLPDGDYQYKATKSGYISSGWATITLTEHESVTSVLIALEETSVIGKKMSDEDIKSMFIPMMYILFIFMLLGAFMYANR